MGESCVPRPPWKQRANKHKLVAWHVGMSACGCRIKRRVNNSINHSGCQSDTARFHTASLNLHLCHTVVREIDERPCVGPHFQIRALDLALSEQPGQLCLVFFRLGSLYLVHLGSTFSPGSINTNSLSEVLYQRRTQSIERLSWPGTTRNQADDTEPADK